MLLVVVVLVVVVSVGLVVVVSVGLVVVVFGSDRTLFSFAFSTAVGEAFSGPWLFVRAVSRADVPGVLVEVVSVVVVGAWVVLLVVVVGGVARGVVV